MNKERIEREINNIEIPREELFASIDKGINKGKKEKRQHRIKSFKVFGAVSSIAASALLASGLIFTPVSNVLAAMPLIGSIYEKIGLSIGQELEDGQLLMEMNQTAFNNGVHVTLTSAYFEGNIIGVSFMMEGEAVSTESIESAGPEVGYSVELFDGVEQEQWSSSNTGLTQTENGFTAGIEFYNPNPNLTEIDTLPITFTSIAGVQGTWSFTVPLQQIPAQTFAVEGQSVAENGYSVSMESVSTGAATTLMNYNVTLPIGREQDEIRLTIFDDEGNRLSKNHAEILSTESSKETIHKNIRELFTSKLSDSATYIMIHPEIVKEGAGSKPVKMEPIRIDLPN